MTQANADKLWSALEAGTPLVSLQKRSNHSDVVVVADTEGNMTAICHSINCVFWGKTGIVVEGVTIGDPAAHQQAIIQEAGPGQRLPDPTCVGMLVENGRPTLAFSSMGAGLHHKTVQCLLNTIDFGMSPKAATDAPGLLAPETKFVDGRGVQVSQVGEGEFSPDVLKASGLAIVEVGREQLRKAQGIWIGVARGPDGALRANAPRHTSGYAEGF